MLVEPLPEAGRAEPAVLVVDARDAARVRELHAVAHRVDVLVVGDVRGSASLNRHAASSRSTPVGSPRRVALDDAALDLEVAARERERGGVEPERVVVLRDQRRGPVAGDRVEIVLRRSAARRSSRASRQPWPRSHAPSRGPRRARRARAPRRATPQPSSRTSCCATAHVGKWTCESVKPGRTQRPPRSTVSGLASAVSCTPTPPAMRSPAIASARDDRQRRIERADDAVLEDHVPSLREEQRCSTMSASTCGTIAASRAFYEQALAPLGWHVVMAFDEWKAAGFGPADKPDFWIVEREPYGTGTHVAFHVRRPRDRRRVPRGGARRGRPRQRRRPASGSTTTRRTTARSCSTPTATTSRPSATRPLNDERPAGDGPFSLQGDARYLTVTTSRRTLSGPVVSMPFV